MWLKVHVDDLIKWHVVGCSELTTNKLCPFFIMFLHFSLFSCECICILYSTINRNCGETFLFLFLQCDIILVAAMCLSKNNCRQKVWQENNYIGALLKSSAPKAQTIYIYIYIYIMSFLRLHSTKYTFFTRAKTRKRTIEQPLKAKNLIKNINENG